ncbi:hypothetical protein BIW11_13944 [Tropilaelaps mercedesae]|uniref:Uncharacterized protein n=1 Tax=Tropilaelaps mercedesae TaxID=418985 RepID=A0A1V9WZZ7_9ACAR|nr:hypothetical protein BIW11_13944 [Tropilaelaps mercedesae]
MHPSFTKCEGMTRTFSTRLDGLDVVCGGVVHLEGASGLGRPCRGGGNASVEEAMRLHVEVVRALFLILLSASLVISFWFSIVLATWQEIQATKIGTGCSLEQNLTCMGACTNKLWYDCSEYLGGKGCFVSYCVPCTDPIYSYDGQECPFLYAEKEECPSYCWHQVPEPDYDLLNEEVFEEDHDDELY